MSISFEAINSSQCNASTAASLVSVLVLEIMPLFFGFFLFIIIMKGEIPFVMLPPETLDIVVALCKILNSYNLLRAPTAIIAALVPPPSMHTKIKNISKQKNHNMNTWESNPHRKWWSWKYNIIIVYIAIKAFIYIYIYLHIPAPSKVFSI